MKKFVMILLIAMFLLSSACDNSITTDKGSQNDNSARAAGVSTLLDNEKHENLVNKTVSPAKIYDISNISELNVLKSDSYMDYIIGDSLDAMATLTTEAVRGEIQEIYYTSHAGMAWIQIDLMIKECYSGSLQEGDVISILQLGGYIPLKEKIAYYGDAERYDYLNENEIENTIVIERHEGEPFPEVGDENIYLLTLADEESERPINSYERVRGACSTFRLVADRATILRYNPDVETTTSRAISFGNEELPLEDLIEAVSQIE